MVTVSLGIPTINQADNLKVAMAEYNSLWHHRHVIIIDNGNQNIDLENKFLKKVAVMPYNMGVAGSWNIIVQNMIQKGYTHVALLNDDIIWRKSANQIEEFIAQNPADLYLGNRAWCIAVLPVDTYLKIGKFDTEFKGAYFEDNDYEYRIKLAGMKILKHEFFNPDVFDSSASIRKDPALNVNFEMNKWRYQQKWGGAPGYEKYSTPMNGGL